MKRLLAAAFYIALTVMGLNFLVIGLFVAAQAFSGQVPKEQLTNITRVLAGRAMFIIPEGEYQEYRKFVADRDAMAKEAADRYGSDEERERQKRDAEIVLADLRDKLAIATSQLDAAKKETLGVRQQVETLKKALDGQQRMFRDEVARQAAVAMDQATRRFRAIMPNTDATRMARTLEEMDPDEAARHFRESFPPDYSAEVIDELRPDRLPVLIPKIENKYAGVPPEQVARMWADRQMGATEMTMYLANMNAKQALSVYLALPPELRESLAPLLISPR